MISIENQTALAAYLYPEQWRTSAKLSGRDRLTAQRDLREKALAEYLTLEVIVEGGRCENCAYFEDEGTCSLHSSRTETVTVTPDHFCPDWEEL